MNPEATGNVAGFAHRSRAFDIPTENLGRYSHREQ